MRFAHGLRVQVFGTALDRPLSAIERLPSGAFVNNLASETWKLCDGLFVVIAATIQLITFTVFLVFSSSSREAHERARFEAASGRCDGRLHRLRTLPGV